MNKKFNVHLDFYASFDIEIEAESSQIAIKKAISEVYNSHALHPEVNIAHCEIQDDFGNKIEEYCYDRPDLSECLTIENGKIVKLDQHSFKYEE